MRELLNNKSILMALGDGGAHVDMLCDAGYQLLGTWVREKQAITLEEGVRKLTSVRPNCSLPGRGRLARAAGGWRSSIPAASARPTTASAATTCRGGAKRIVMPSEGQTRRERRRRPGAGPAHQAKAGKVLAAADHLSVQVSRPAFELYSADLEVRAPKKENRCPSAVRDHEILSRLRPCLQFDAVPDELIAKILRAGIYATNGGNTQKWRFLVIKDPKIKKAMQSLVQEGVR